MSSWHPICSCGGAWRPATIDHGAAWGTHHDVHGLPALPKPGCRLPDGKFVTGRSGGGSYVSADGSVLD